MKKEIKMIPIKIVTIPHTKVVHQILRDMIQEMIEIRAIRRRPLVDTISIMKRLVIDMGIVLREEVILRVTKENTMTHQRKGGVQRVEASPDLDQIDLDLDRIDQKNREEIEETLEIMLDHMESLMTGSMNLAQQLNMTNHPINRIQKQKEDHPHQLIQRELIDTEEKIIMI
jgi:hypothetical protein